MSLLLLKPPERKLFCSHISESSIIYGTRNKQVIWKILETLIFKILIYYFHFICEAQREKPFYPLVHFPNVHNSWVWGWARRKQTIKNSIRISHVLDSDSSTWAPPAAFPEHTLTGKWMGNRVGNGIRNLDLRYSHCASILSTVPITHSNTDFFDTRVESFPFFALG